MAATQMEIARQVGLDISSVNKILNRRAGAVFKPATVEQVFRVAKRLGFRCDHLKRTHRRSHERREVQISATLAIYGADGSLFDQGTCSISDIAICGASLVDVQLPKSKLPVEPFTVRLGMTGK